MDTIDIRHQYKKPWRKAVFPLQPLSSSSMSAADSSSKFSYSTDNQYDFDVDRCISTYVSNVLDAFNFNLYFQSRYDVVDSAVKSYRDHLENEALYDFSLHGSQYSNINPHHTTSKIKASQYSEKFYTLLSRFVQIATYLFIVSVQINDDFHIDFEYFLSELKLYSIDEIETLLLDDFLAMKKARKYMDYLPQLLGDHYQVTYPSLTPTVKNQLDDTGLQMDIAMNSTDILTPVNPSSGTLSGSNFGVLSMTDQELEEIYHKHNIRDLFDSIEGNISYLRSQSQAQDINTYSKLIKETQKDILSLNDMKSPLNRNKRQSMIIEDEFHVDAQLMAQTILSLETDAQLFIDQTSDIELDELLKKLTEEQVKGCDEINAWGTKMKEKISSYFTEKRFDGTIGNPFSLLAPSNVAQDMDESNIQFEAKLMETMEKKSDLDQLISSKVQMMTDIYGHGSSVDAMVAWLREVSAEKALTSEKVANLLSTIYGNMITAYIQENRSRKVLRKL